MGISAKFAIFLPKLDVYSGKNARQICLKTNIWIKLDYYSNNHIICIIYAKCENIELFQFSSENITNYNIQMFSRASRNNICIKKLDIYVNTHLICIRYANIYTISRNMLYFPIKQCSTLYKLYAEQLKTY